MAGLLSRTTLIIKAKYSKLLNRAENPTETLDYSYEQMLEQLQNVKRGVAVVAEPGEWDFGGIHVRGIATPGHSDDMVAFVAGDEIVFTGDTLFKDAVGGGHPARVRSSVMDVFMTLPDEMQVLPGHTEETTIGREREHNPFVRVWSGAEPEGGERVSVGGREATLLVWSPDYDGKGKAWVRFDDGGEAIVGGSRVSR